ncbi:MAG: 3-deoxy-D-manno-octulosonic acid transferase [Acidobacteria bacterium]|nr:3-deoxy-D-manno-octulosonic acid transferase [Acidobacteriota bacterium]MBW4046316.1 3-deoxy-D-manno-octulosonic acid transferase [Acidobacteriota bacterium]
MVADGRYREGLAERLGQVPSRLQGKGVVWVHAVSVGEVIAASRFVEELRARGVSIVLSTTTRTGQQLARERFGAANVFYFPLDFAFAVRAYLRSLEPRMLVLVESEFWPRMLAECYRCGIPVAVINARVSDRSWPRYRALRLLWKRLLGRLSLVLAQSSTDRERLIELGAGNVVLGGNLKFDVRVAGVSALTAAIDARRSPGMKVIVGGSTLEGEEQMLLDAAPPEALLVIAPRHPERFDAVADLLTRSGRKVVRRSQWAAARAPLLPGMVFLLDSIGELASLYSVADVAFVGGSLVPAGGHNPLEPAQFGVPVLMGPHYENFRSIVGTLRTHDAIGIVERPQLQGAIVQLLSDSSAARAMGARARSVFEREAGATARAVDAVMQLLESAR